VLHQVRVGALVTLVGQVVHLHVLRVAGAHLGAKECISGRERKSQSCTTVSRVSHSNIFQDQREKRLTSLYVGLTFAVAGPMNPT
jgi:hypothetical protein